MGVGRRREIQVDEMEWWKGLAMPREGKGNGGRERESERTERSGRVGWKGEVGQGKVGGKGGTG